MKKSAKKNIKAVSVYKSTWTYQGTIDLAKLGGFVFNHGTASSKHTRTRDHIRDCLDQQLVYEVRREEQDRLFGNKVIASSYDKVFVAKVVEELNKTVLLSSVHKAMMLKDWKVSLPMLSNIERGYYDALCKANLSETECCFIPSEVSESDLKAVISVVDAWYYNDKAIRVPAVALKNNTLHFTQKHLVGSKLIKFIEERFPRAKKMLHTPGNTIVLIGQFCPDFVAALAMFNKVIIWHDATDQQHVYEYEALNERITYIESMEELLDTCMNVDPKNLLIIANPPYGKPGADIAKTIVDNIDYAEFINLLPVNDYKRVKDLYKHAELASMVPIRKGFADAAVTTHIARITKQPSNISLEEFEIENYIEPKYKKYFYVLRTRKHYAIDSANCPYWHNGPENISNKKVFILGERDISSKRFPTNKDSVVYKWNVEKSATSADLHIATNDQLSQIICKFDTEQECQNFTQFCYDNVEFMSKLFRAVNADKMKVLYKVFPKVDWTRSWTVEEILADYGYTKAEIDEVMADLINFKGMED